MPAAFDCRTAAGTTCADRTADAAAVGDRFELVLAPASAAGAIPTASVPTIKRQSRARPRSKRVPLDPANIGFTATSPPPGFEAFLQLIHS
jgi:hypothetical protein